MTWPTLDENVNWATPDDLQELLRRAEFLLEKRGAPIEQLGGIRGYRIGLVSIIKFDSGGFEIRCSPSHGELRSSVYWRKDPWSDTVDHYDESLAMTALNDLRKHMVLDDIAGI